MSENRLGWPADVATPLLNGVYARSPKRTSVQRAFPALRVTYYDLAHGTFDGSGWTIAIPTQLKLPGAVSDPAINVAAGRKGILC